MKSQPLLRANCPGKIFILGEYACLNGHPALLSSIGPHYELELGTFAADKPFPFHPESPAGKLICLDKYKALSRSWGWTWRDPHKIAMGFGSSSAQFLLAKTLLENRTDPPSMKEAKFLLETYWECTWNARIPNRIRPSGLDLINQYFGGTNLLSRTNEGEISREMLKTWPNGDSELILLFTRKKVQTHSHLETLSGHHFFNTHETLFKNLSHITKDVAAGAWKTGNGHELGRAFNEYQGALFKDGLAPEDFHTLVKWWSKIPGVLGCKGSGAQGGDCVLLVIENGAFEKIRKINDENHGEIIRPQWMS